MSADLKPRRWWTTARLWRGEGEGEGEGEELQELQELLVASPLHRHVSAPVT